MGIIALKKILSINGFPILTEFKESDFKGEFHIICASGLGNHLYDFSLAMNLKNLFKSAEIILWTSSEYQYLAKRLKNIKVESYKVKTDNNSNFRIDFDLKEIYDVVKKNILSAQNKGRVSYLISSPFFPDGLQTFLGETAWECPLRLFSGNNSLKHYVRPIFPLEDSERIAAYSYLKENGLEDDPYIVMSPHVAPGKSWDLEGFSSQANKIMDNFGIRTIFPGFFDSPKLKVKGSLQPYGMSLPLIAALIEKSTLFIGHDSGLTHLALAFNRPSLTIFIDKNVPPTFIRSPLEANTSFVGAYLGLKKEDGVETILSWAGSHLCKNEPSFSSPKCPCCGQESKFLLEITMSYIIWICECGSANKIMKDDFSLKNFKNKNVNLMTFPQTIQELSLFSALLSEENPQTLSISLRIPIFFEGSFFKDFFSQNDANFLGSWEGIFIFMEKHGYFPLILSWERNNDFWKGVINFSKVKMADPIQLPIKGKIVTIPSYEIARKYYKGIDWISSDYFSKQWKILMNWNHFGEAKRISLEALRIYPSKVNLRNVIRSHVLSFLNQVL